MRGLYSEPVDLLFFFFKQKTAYEIHRYWSSDVCSSDLFMGFKTSRLDLLNPKHGFNKRWLAYIEEFGDHDDAVILVEGAGREQVGPALDEFAAAQIGRASCRERVYSPGVGVT